MFSKKQYALYISELHVDRAKMLTGTNSFTLRCFEKPKRSLKFLLRLFKMQ